MNLLLSTTLSNSNNFTMKHGYWMHGLLIASHYFRTDFTAKWDTKKMLSAFKELFVCVNFEWGIVALMGRSVCFQSSANSCLTDSQQQGSSCPGSQADRFLSSAGKAPDSSDPRRETWPPFAFCWGYCEMAVPSTAFTKSLLCSELSWKPDRKKVGCLGFLLWEWIFSVLPLPLSALSCF